MRSEQSDSTLEKRKQPPLKRLRLCAGFDVIEAATKAGYSPSALRNIEHRRRRIRTKSAHAILALYGVIPNGRALKRYFAGLC